MDKVTRALIRDIRWLALAKRGGLFLAGNFAVSYGLSLIIVANLGVSSWAVLYQGLSKRFGVSIGQASFLVSMLLIAVTWYCGLKPTIGTLASAAGVACFLDVISKIGFLPKPGNLVQCSLCLGAGIIINGFGLATYACSGCGFGPRDGLMIALVRKTQLRVGIVRGTVEIATVITGFFLGGNVGPGTVAYALAVGWVMEAGFRTIRYLSDKTGILKGTIVLPGGVDT